MDYILVDFSNLAYSAFFKTIAEERLKPENIPKYYDSHIYNFRDKLEVALRESGFPNPTYVFAMDNKPKEKMELMPEYKQNRKKLDFNPKIAVVNMIKQWPCLQAEAKYAEADDVIASLVKMYYNHNFVVLTTDRDLWVLRRYPNVRIFDPFKRAFISTEHLKEKFKLDRWDQIEIHKILWGDSSDQIPNRIPRMQKQLLPVIAKTNGSLDDFLYMAEMHKDDLSKRCLELLSENHEGLRLNEKLVKLRTDLEIKFTSHPQST